MSLTNFSEVTIHAKSRLEKQLCELGLSAELAGELISRHTLVNCNKGAMVFLQGSPADVVFYVLSGLIKVYCPRSDGARIMVKLAGPGDLVGYVDYVDARGRRAQAFEAQALTKSSVALLTRDHITQVLNVLERPALLQVIERLNTAWSSTAQWFATFLSMSFRQRLELVLKELSTRFGVRDSRGILITPELAHTDFADMVGCSRPMVTRLMAEMTKAGLLLRQGKQFILREPAATAILEEGTQRCLPHSTSNGISKNGSHTSPAAASKVAINLSRWDITASMSLLPAVNGKRAV